MKASPMVWTGRVLSALFVLFMLGASVAPKFLTPDVGLDYIRSLNIDPADVPLIGAIATHVHVDSPLFSHTLFGVYLGLIMWAGLWLRDPALRALLPLRRSEIIPAST